MALLIAIAALTVWLALRADSQAFAGLAIAGGFLAPMLTSTRGAPLPLFGYFAILNGAIFALAWRRAWRALNVLGFVFTFALGLFWGERYYASEHFATVEPFLVLFFAYYVAIAILEARRGALEVQATRRRPAGIRRAAGGLRAAGGAGERLPVRRRMERAGRWRWSTACSCARCAAVPSPRSRCSRRRFSRSR